MWKSSQLLFFFLLLETKDKQFGFGFYEVSSRNFCIVIIK